MKKKIRVGFLGAGSWAMQKHLPVLKAIQDQRDLEFEVELAALCEHIKERRKKAAETFGFSRSYSDLNDFAQDRNLDCFAVVVSPSRLIPIVEKLSRRGLPLYSEKPPGLSVRDARRLARMVRVPNVVGFNRRYYPIIERFRALIDLSETYYVSCNFCRHERHDSQRARDGEKRAVPFVVGTGIHAINTLEYLFGKIASCRTELLDDEKGWLSDLRFASGLKGRLNLLPLSGSNTEWIEVQSRSQSLYVRYGMYGNFDYPGQIVIHRQGRKRDVICGDASAGRLVNEGFVAGYLDFFRAILSEGRETRSNFQNAVNSMRVALEIEDLE